MYLITPCRKPSRKKYGIIFHHLYPQQIINRFIEEKNKWTITNLNNNSSTRTNQICRHCLIKRLSRYISFEQSTSETILHQNFITILFFGENVTKSTDNTFIKIALSFHFFFYKPNDFTIGWFQVEFKNLLLQIMNKFKCV